MKDKIHKIRLKIYNKSKRCPKIKDYKIKLNKNRLPASRTSKSLLLLLSVLLYLGRLLR